MENVHPIMTASCCSTIANIFEKRAVQTPEQTFLHLPQTECSVSYSKFDRLSAGLDNELLRIAGHPLSCIGTLLPNGIEAALAILTVLRSKATLVPMNPRLTWREIGNILEQSSPELILLSPAHALIESFVEKGWVQHQVSLPETDLVALVQGSTIEQSRPELSGASLLLFTSGTTGKPKGVILSENNLLANAGYVNQAHEITSSDIALCLLPLYHINGLVVTLLAPLLAGIPVVMPERFSIDKFWSLIARYKPTWFSAVPTIFSKILSEPQPEKDLYASLRFARSASASLPEAVLQQFEARFALPLIEAYGISEAACQVCSNPLPPGIHKPGSVGVPYGNEVKVVDSEVWVRGPNVFSGYLDRPQESTDALLDGWFRTGDLGWMDTDGYLYLTGRKKELINRAGEKIAPREIEEVLHELPQIESAGVAGIPSSIYGEEVAAFLVLRPGNSISVEDVSIYCRKKLADFKVPRTILFVEELPKGPSGKVQRRLLTELYLRTMEITS
ncbi:MAG: AMP-binding protein [Chlorobiaceae bacterium]|nr:AMP-binding protein [Chlorobiaceae bacterium]